MFSSISKKYFATLFVLCIILFLSSLNACKNDDDDTGTESPYPIVNFDTIPYNPTAYELQIPSGFPEMEPFIPTDNPLTEEGVQLGRKLFYDPILSADSTLSCGGCHNQQFAFTDSGKRFSTGVDNIAGNRNAMAIINLGWSDRLFWDARANGLEDQALGPVPNPIEMHLEWEDAVDRLMKHYDYRVEFYKAFGIEEITKEDVVKAIAQFERTMISGNSRIDRFLRGEPGIFLSDDEILGMEIFSTETGDCFHCHTFGTGHGFYNDDMFHNNGLDCVDNPADYPDLGLGEITGNPDDNGLFRTPTLRNITLTAPYMHDGGFATLEEVIDHYSDGICDSPNLDNLIRTKFDDNGDGTFGLNLTDEQKTALVAFLNALTDTSFINNPDFSNPFED